MYLYLKWSGSSESRKAQVWLQSSTTQRKAGEPVEDQNNNFWVLNLYKNKM